MNGQSGRTELGVDLAVKWAYSNLLPLGIREPEETGKHPIEIFASFNAVLPKPRNTLGYRGQMLCTKLDSVFP